MMIWNLWIDDRFQFPSDSDKVESRYGTTEARLTLFSGFVN